MAKPKGTHFIVSANFLASGAPAYRRSDGLWTTRLEEAHAAATTDERDAMLASAEREEGEVADPYFFEARFDAGRLDPLTAREQIRANGPTVAYGPGRTGLAR